jgi:subfamily B ATP-binding cassette protein MsbA
MLMAILDGAGLAMFIPLLQIAGGDNEADGKDMGELAHFVDWLVDLGFTLTITNVLLFMLIFFVLKGVAKFVSSWYKVILLQRFANRIRLENMRLLAGYDYEEFAKADSGRIQNTFSGEVQRISNAYRNYFVMMQQAIMTAVYVGLAYISNPKFAIIVAIGGAVSNLAFNRIYKTTKVASRRVSNKTHGFQGFLIQSVTSFKFLKATNLMGQYKQKIDDSIVDIEKEQRLIGTMNTLASAIREPLIITVVIIAIFIQVSVFEQSITGIILSLLFFYRGLGSLVQVQNFYNSFLGSSGALENMEEFIDELTEAQEDTGTLPFNGLTTGIQTTDLTFAYDDQTVLSGINLTIDKNETIGLVGESGAGKTTLVNLICGLLKPDRNMIAIDGTDLLDLDIYSYRAKIGYVTQEAQMFSDTVFNNVTFWEEKSEHSEARFWRALKLAHAAEFVRNLPQGEDTRIGINGVNLSGGQPQRILIARELYRDVDILVLDEATSALDSQSERLIQENIDSLKGNYTMFVIAHRLSTIQKADKIIYLRSDGSYDIGSFNELKDSNVGFKNMVDLQAIGTLH